MIDCPYQLPPLGDSVLGYMFDRDLAKAKQQSNDMSNNQTSSKCWIPYH